MTIRDIFKLSNDGYISDDLIWEALALCDLTTRIVFLDEILKLDGSNFSGGEMSRLSMAIGCSRKPDILIVDETLANLNPEMRKTLYLKLRKSIETIIMITHDQNFLTGDERFIHIESQL